MIIRNATSFFVAVLMTLAFGAQRPAGQAAPDTETAARELVPLLKSVKQRLQPRVGLAPGSLPPSPFTGRNSTVVAVRIGKSDVDVDPKVRSALDRLLAWNRKVSPEADDAVLFGHWLDHVRLRAASMAPPGSTGSTAECDTACAIERFTKPGEAFGSSADERMETRDRLLLEALVDAVHELDP